MDDKLKLKITVSGKIGSGKSQIASLIEKTLKDAGFEVNATDLDRTEALLTPPTNLKNLKEAGLVIDLTVHQPHRTEEL